MFFGDCGNIYRDENAKTLSYKSSAGSSPFILTDKLIDELRRAGQTTGGIARLCINPSPDNLLHQMLIFFPAGSGYGLHMHPEKNESYLLVKGKMELRYTADPAKEPETVVMPDDAVSIYMPAGTWHALSPKDGDAIIYEFREGPFNPDKPDAVFY